MVFLKKTNYWNLLFYAVALLHLYPILFTNHFLTVDGPAHLYNANLIFQLLFEPSSIANDYFIFNPIVVPNWLSHIILLFASKVFNPFIAEKILLCSYVFLLPITFKNLVDVTNLNANKISFIVFPFVYAFPLTMGFWGYCLSLPILFYSLSVYFKFSNNTENLNKLGLFVLLILLYFSHLMAFVLFALVVFVNETVKIIGKIKGGNNNFNRFILLFNSIAPSKFKH